MAKITGIDVSEWQESIDWAAVKPQIDFTIFEIIGTVSKKDQY